MPPFGFNRMTTDRGGFMELRVWFWGSFSVLDVHWQKRAEKGGRDKKKRIRLYFGFINQESFPGAAEIPLAIRTSLIALTNRQADCGCIIRLVQKKSSFAFNRLILTVA